MKLTKFQLVVPSLILLVITYSGIFIISCNKDPESCDIQVYHNVDPEEFAGVPERTPLRAEQAWKTGILTFTDYYVDEIRLAKLVSYENLLYCIVVYGGSRNNEISVSPVYHKAPVKTITRDYQLDWHLRDNLRQEGENIYFYTLDDSAFHFSLIECELVKDETYPFEKIDWVNGVVSPDEKYMVCWSNIELYLKNLKTDEKEILWHEEYYGDWSIGDVVWSEDSKRLYFDNSGPQACIWEYQLESSTLTKIVPDHEAMFPSVVYWNSWDYVCYVQGATIRIASNDPEAAGFIDPEFLGDGAFEFPLSVRPEPEEIKFLDVILFDEIEETGSYSLDWEEESEEKTVWKLGTITSGEYSAGTLFRIETQSSGKMEDYHVVRRCIKKDEMLIFLPLCSSAKYGYQVDNEKYRIYFNDEIYKSEIFKNCREVIIDFSVAVKGMYIPDTLLYVPGQYSIRLVEETVLNTERENAYNRINDPASLKIQMQAVDEDEHLGEIFIERDPRREDRHEDLEYLGGALFAYTIDGCLLVYGLIPKFLPVIYGRIINQGRDYTWVSDAGYTDGEWGDLDIACIYTQEELANQLEYIGYTDFGDTIWGFPTDDHPVLRKEYQRIESAYNEYSYEGMDELIDYETFASELSMYFWKDPYGRYIRFLSRDYLSPQMAEPIIYLYDDRARTVTLRPDEIIDIIHSIPRIETSWEIIGSASGQVTMAGTGKQYDYLFWEGYAGFIPRMSRGFVVSREEVPEFFDEKLKVLGLVDHEIEDFKEAWLGGFTGSPWYFIAFYEQEIIDRFAPLHLDPMPETIIRVMMDYEALSGQISAEEPVLKHPPERSGLTLIEWGGLKR